MCFSKTMKIADLEYLDGALWSNAPIFAQWLFYSAATNTWIFSERKPHTVNGVLQAAGQSVAHKDANSIIALSNFVVTDAVILKRPKLRVSTSRRATLDEHIRRILVSLDTIDSKVLRLTKLFAQRTGK